MVPLATPGDAGAVSSSAAPVIPRAWPSPLLSKDLRLSRMPQAAFLAFDFMCFLFRSMVYSSRADPISGVPCAAGALATSARILHECDGPGFHQ